MKSSIALIALAVPQACLLAYPHSAFAQSEPVVVPEIAEPEEAAPAETDNPDEIEFSANLVEYDFESDIVTASGDVLLNRDGYRLRADSVIWNRNTGVVEAKGNIRSTSPEGDTAYGDSIILTDSLRDGTVENLLLVMEDGSRLAARKGERFADGSMTLDNGAYTACPVVSEEGCPKDPSW